MDALGEVSFAHGPQQYYSYRAVLYYIIIYRTVLSYIYTWCIYNIMYSSVAIAMYCIMSRVFSM